jgi:chromosome segregation protein
MVLDKNGLLQNFINESDFLVKQIDTLSLELFDMKTDAEKLNLLRTTLKEKSESLDNLNRREIELEKLLHTNEFEIEKETKIIDKISKMDICPLCKSRITEEHMKTIHEEINPNVDKLKTAIANSEKELSGMYKTREVLISDIDGLKSELTKRESDLVNLAGIRGKSEQIKLLREKIEDVKNEIAALNKRKKFLEDSFDENSNIEQKYELVRVEVQEISLRTEENVNSEISFKQREFERSKISLKQLVREEDDLDLEISEIRKTLEDKEGLLDVKKKKEEELTKKFQKLIAERDGLQAKIRENESEVMKKQNVLHGVEQEINNFNIDKARVGATIEGLETEMLEFDGVEVIRMNKDKLVDKLAKTQDILSRIGSVNLRSLEVYDSVKEEYDSIKNKVELISKEKDGILKIIHEIDIKKKKAFLGTLSALNEIFSRNFSQLSAKGQVSLELENRKDPFEGGVNIIVKTGHGKYFDVTSLSGGEQTLVALSLIFAIQELKPYCFYILDEIDAALDKRNSERLAGLLKKYMQKGQYIVITHNDEIISNATNLYGVSMHDGISKVISLKL